MKDPKPASGTLEVPRRMAGKILEAPKRGGLFGANLPRANLPPAPVRPYEPNETRGEREAARDAFAEIIVHQSSGPNSPAPLDAIIAQAMQVKALTKTQAKAQLERQPKLRAQLERQRAMQADRRAPEALSTGPQPRTHSGTPKPPLTANTAASSHNIAPRNTAPRNTAPQNGEEWMEQLVERLRDQQKMRPSSGSGPNADSTYALAIAGFIAVPILILWTLVGSSALFILSILLWFGSNKLYAFASGTREPARIARQQLARIHPSWSDPDTARLHLRILAGMCIMACVMLQWDIIFG